jgi:hypothetical protein
MAVRFTRGSNLLVALCRALGLDAPVRSIVIRADMKGVATAEAEILILSDAGEAVATELRRYRLVETADVPPVDEAPADE